MRRALLLALSASLLVACNSDDSPTITADGSTTSSTSGESTTTTTFEGTSLPASAPASSTRGYLKDVRIAGQAGFDRVVFEFEDALPGYQVATATPPFHEDGSGDEVRVRGQAFLRVVFENAATARVEGEDVDMVYTGPDHVPGGDAKLVLEAVDAGDFEGMVTWVIGLEGVLVVRVSALDSPHRLVIDVQTDS